MTNHISKNLDTIGSENVSHWAITCTYDDLTSVRHLGMYLCEISMNM